MPLRRFYTRRALRIFPAYYLMLLGVLVFFGANPRFLYAATYTCNFRADPTLHFHHVWSLCIEEHFYLVWPLLVALPPVWLSKRLAMLALLASVGGYIAFETWSVWTSQAGWTQGAGNWTPFAMAPQ